MIRSLETSDDTGDAPRNSTRSESANSPVPEQSDADSPEASRPESESGSVFSFRIKGFKRNYWVSSDGKLEFTDDKTDTILDRLV